MNTLSLRTRGSRVLGTRRYSRATRVRADLQTSAGLLVDWVLGHPVFRRPRREFPRGAGGPRKKRLDTQPFYA